MFPRPLIRNPELVGAAPDEMIDWEGAASANEHYYAIIRHYAAEFGVRRFMMVNEPEFHWKGFYLPAHVRAVGKDWFRAFFRGYDRESERRDYFAAIATQYAVLARLARIALDDVSAGLGDPNARLTLSSPVTGKWEDFWRAAQSQFDVFRLSPVR